MNQGNQMATDLDDIVRNLCNSYDFRGKIILSVGAGGGQLIDYGRLAQKVIAVDKDPVAIEVLKHRLSPKGLLDKFEIVESDFFDIATTSDVVLFEFSLHEIPDPERALAHAKSLAPDVVVLDHEPGSDWAYVANEELKVGASTKAVLNLDIQSHSVFTTEQLFDDYLDLSNKIRGQGETAMNRISAFLGVEPIRIPMSYSVCVLSHSEAHGPPLEA